MSRRARRAGALAGAMTILSLAGGCRPPPPPRPAAAPVEAAPAPLHADHIVVFKAKHLLELLRGGEVVARFPVSLGEHPRGPKESAGDGRTPEGRYIIDGRSTETRYTAELHISYPNAQDRARAAALHVEPGGGIYLHGLPRDYGPFDPPFRFHDWTNGCIGVGNVAIRQIWDAAPNRTPIDILP
jgi:murein L,D-transpeptidase YafK